jgi:hypothetical protein
LDAVVPVLLDEAVEALTFAAAAPEDGFSP